MKKLLVCIAALIGLFIGNQAAYSYNLPLCDINKIGITVTPVKETIDDEIVYGFTISLPEEGSISTGENDNILISASNGTILLGLDCTNEAPEYTCTITDIVKKSDTIHVLFHYEGSSSSESCAALSGDIDLKESVDLDDDSDMDGIANDEDNCPDDANEDQEDEDEDGIGDACAAKDGEEINPDIDDDGILNEDDDDMDGDGKLNKSDNCPQVSNKDQKDEDKDGIGAACDENDKPTGGPKSAGDCSLSPLSASNAIGWIFDLAVLGAPFAFLGYRRKK